MELRPWQPEVLPIPLRAFGKLQTAHNSKEKLQTRWKREKRGGEGVKEVKGLKKGGGEGVKEVKGLKKGEVVKGLRK